ncbi:MFS transporter [Paenibacillus sp. ISL-20]|uniref:MFS transporter n=1 Tax=Paenibacillus sp. ISL-20 TaxID=2819163 RepID=UPI001BE8AD7B|nr:MFS transporter [Paenibacillus sp. ISL-20]MBT2761343.1 MFS transporter [Paenibacillus sp. ISL-20]
MSRYNSFIIFILAFGVFGIINTEMGFIGILPQLAARFDIPLSQAGLLVSLFALAVAISGLFMPLLLSGINSKASMLLVMGLFSIAGFVSVYAPTFEVLLIARIIPAFLHPVFFSVAFVAAANSVSKEFVTRANSRIFMGVTAGMVIGSPIATLLADVLTLQASLYFFAIVNAITFIAILIFIPSMPVKEKLTYGSQLGVLRKPVVWISIITMIVLNAGMYATFSFFAEFLDGITGMSGRQISLMLLVFGATGFIGNILSGILLNKRAMQTALVYPIIFGIVYLLIYMLGDYSIPMTLLIAIWGTLYTLGLNLCQNSITTAAYEAPTFANGMFIAFGNLGISFGTFVGGAFIADFGTRSIIWAGILFMVLSFVFIAVRAFRYTPKKVHA